MTVSMIQSGGGLLPTASLLRHFPSWNFIFYTDTRHELTCSHKLQEASGKYLHKKHFKNITLKKITTHS